MEKRQDYIDWHTFFMNTAILSSMRSKDPTTQVGACIVDKNNKIISVGYNGFPSGCSDDLFPWCKNEEKDEDNKYAYVIHAEMNAILNKNLLSLDNCIIYTTHFPCRECTKVIIQSGIKQIYFLYERIDNASLKMLNNVGVKYIKLELTKRVRLSFTNEDIKK